jgi:CheY-like chemotaxis protein
MKRLKVEILLLCLVPTVLFSGYVLRRYLGELSADESSTNLLALSDAVGFLGLFITTALILVYRINRYITRPIQEITDHLRNKDRPPVTGPMAELGATIDGYLKHIEQAHVAELHEARSEKKRVTSLLAMVEKSNRDVTQNAEKLHLATNQEAVFLENMHFLCAPPLKGIIGLTNRILVSDDHHYLTGELVNYARQLQFLINETQRGNPLPVDGIQDPRLLIDEILALLHPLSAHLHIDLLPFFDESVPETLTAESRGASRSLETRREPLGTYVFHYLLHYLLHRRLQDLPQEPDVPQSLHRQTNVQQHDPRPESAVDHATLRHSEVCLNISCSIDDELILELKADYPETAVYRRFDSILNAGHVTLQDGRLQLPVRTHRRTSTYPAQGLTAVISVDNTLLRQSLQNRLHHLGMRITTDFKSEDVDICFADDQSSDTFLTVQQYLDSNVTVFLLNSPTLHNVPNWISLKIPLNQQQLIEQIERLDLNQVIEQEHRRVLAVDDSRANRQLLVLQLEELGHEVATAKNGSEALSLCLAEPFDLVFMDVQMPELNGIEATRRIRSGASHQPKIIGLTAHVSPEEQQACFAAGMDDVMVKPVKIDAVKELTQAEKMPAPKPVQRPAAENTLFDMELSLNAANNRPELADELFTLLIASLPIDQEAINAAFSAGNTEEVREAAHKLLGPVRYCGVPRLTTAVEKVVTIAKTGAATDVERALNILNGEVSSLLLWSQENPDPFNTHQTS